MKNTILKSDYHYIMVIDTLSTIVNNKEKDYWRVAEALLNDIPDAELRKIAASPDIEVTCQLIGRDIDPAVGFTDEWDDIIFKTLRRYKDKDWISNNISNIYNLADSVHFLEPIDVFDWEGKLFTVKEYWCSICEQYETDDKMGDQFNDNSVIYSPASWNAILCATMGLQYLRNIEFHDSYDHCFEDKLDNLDEAKKVLDDLIASRKRDLLKSVATYIFCNAPHKIDNMTFYKDSDNKIVRVHINQDIPSDSTDWLTDNEWDILVDRFIENHDVLYNKNMDDHFKNDIQNIHPQIRNFVRDNPQHKNDIINYWMSLIN